MAVDKEDLIGGALKGVSSVVDAIGNKPYVQRNKARKRGAYGVKKSLYSPVDSEARVVGGVGTGGIAEGAAMIGEAFDKNKENKAKFEAENQAVIAGRDKEGMKKYIKNKYGIEG
jgi:hypothetical protein